MSRLPEPGGDDGLWGEILNDYLSVSHMPDGTIKTSALPTAPVTSVAGKTGVVTLDSIDVGLGNVDDTSDTDKPVSTAQQAALDTKTDIADTAALDGRVTAIEDPGIIALLDGANIATDAAAGKHFRVSIVGDRTLDPPTNASDGMQRIWEITASGAGRILTLTTGSAGSFELTTSLTSSFIISDGSTHFIGAVYNASRNRWTVLASRATI